MLDAYERSEDIAEFYEKIRTIIAREIREEISAELKSSDPKTRSYSDYESELEGADQASGSCASSDQEQQDETVHYHDAQRFKRGSGGGHRAESEIKHEPMESELEDADLASELGISSDEEQPDETVHYRSSQKSKRDSGRVHQAEPAIKLEPMGSDVEDARLKLNWTVKRTANSSLRSPRSHPTKLHKMKIITKLCQFAESHRKGLEDDEIQISHHLMQMYRHPRGLGHRKIRSILVTLQAQKTLKLSYPPNWHRTGFERDLIQKESGRLNQIRGVQRYLKPPTKTPGWILTPAIAIRDMQVDTLSPSERNLGEDPTQRPGRFAIPKLRNPQALPWVILTQQIPPMIEKSRHGRVRVRTPKRRSGQRKRKRRKRRSEKARRRRRISLAVVQMAKPDKLVKELIRYPN